MDFLLLFLEDIRKNLSKSLSVTLLDCAHFLHRRVGIVSERSA